MDVNFGEPGNNIIRYHLLCSRDCHAEKGPVFVTAFNPLMMIIVAIMGAFILAEKIYLGG